MTQRDGFDSWPWLRLAAMSIANGALGAAYGRDMGLVGVVLFVILWCAPSGMLMTWES